MDDDYDDSDDSDRVVLQRDRPTQKTRDPSTIPIDAAVLENAVYHEDPLLSLGSVIEVWMQTNGAAYERLKRDDTFAESRHLECDAFVRDSRNARLHVTRFSHGGLAFKYKCGSTVRTLQGAHATIAEMWSSVTAQQRAGSSSGAATKTTQRDARWDASVKHSEATATRTSFTQGRSGGGGGGGSRSNPHGHVREHAMIAGERSMMLGYDDEEDASLERRMTNPEECMKCSAPPGTHHGSLVHTQVAQMCAAVVSRRYTLVDWLRNNPEVDGCALRFMWTFCRRGYWPIRCEKCVYDIDIEFATPIDVVIANVHTGAIGFMEMKTNSDTSHFNDHPSMPLMRGCMHQVRDSPLQRATLQLVLAALVARQRYSFCPDFLVVARIVPQTGRVYLTDPDPWAKDGQHIAELYRSLYRRSLEAAARRAGRPASGRRSSSAKSKSAGGKRKSDSTAPSSKRRRFQ